MQPGSALDNKQLTYASIAQLDSAIFTLISMRINLASAAAKVFPASAPAQELASFTVFAVVATETSALSYVVTPGMPLSELLHWISLDAGACPEPRRFFCGGAELLPCDTPLSAFDIGENTTIYVV